MRACALALALALSTCNAWVLPGTAPIQYGDGETVELKVNKLTSPKTHLGYEHYSLAFCRVRSPGGRPRRPGAGPWRPTRRLRAAPRASAAPPPPTPPSPAGPTLSPPRPAPPLFPLPSAQPIEGIKKSAENLGEHLSGELIENSGYDVSGCPAPCPGALRLELCRGEPLLPPLA